MTNCTGLMGGPTRPSFARGLYALPARLRPQDCPPNRPRSPVIREAESVGGSPDRRRRGFACLWGDAPLLP